MSIEGKEKLYFYSYLRNNNLDYSKSTLISDYLNGFECSDRDLYEVKNLKKLEQALELMMPESDRKLNGAFFTPTSIVRKIINEVSPTDQETCVDLACGCGAFLIELVEYLYQTSNKDIKTILSNNIFGVDILEYNVRRAKLLLCIYALENGEIINDEHLNIYRDNSLAKSWGQFDVIVGNPPYVKFQDLSDESRVGLLKEYVTTTKGTFNLYFAFFELGFKLLNDNGRLGFITPNNFFTSLSAEPLRKFFGRERSVSKIIDFSHRKVFNAQTYTAITILDRSRKDKLLYSKIKDSENIDQYLANIQFSENPYDELKSKKWRLLRTNEQINVKKIESSGFRIDELFKISVGIATLKDQLYFVDDRINSEKFFTKEFNGVSFLIEKDITKEIYKISDFKTIDSILENHRRIIFPYVKNTQGKLIPISEQKLLQRYPNCYNYLNAIRDELVKREKKNKIIPFYIFGRSQGLNNEGPKLLTPTFSRFPRFMRTQNDEALYCNGYGVSEKVHDVGRLFNSVNPLSKMENLDVVQRILNSYVMHYYITTTSVSIQGGYPCYQKNFLVRFTFPNFTNEEIFTIRNFKTNHELDYYLIKKYNLSISDSDYQEYVKMRIDYTSSLKRKLYSESNFVEKLDHVSVS